MRSPKKKSAKAKAKPKKDTRPQRERFEEAAKAAGGIDADAFDGVMGRIAAPKKPKR